MTKDPNTLPDSSKSEHCYQLATRISRLTPLQLVEVERLVAKFELNSQGDASQPVAPYPHWPHAPVHKLGGKGTYIVTAGTLYKEHHFYEHNALNYLQTELLTKAQHYGWQIEAWACFSNHYHFVGHALEDSKSLTPFLTHLHADTSREINRGRDRVERQLWFNFWETKLTYEKSYLARLNYVHQNAVHHGLVANANQYPWCSAAWFERTAKPAQVKTIYHFKTDKLRVLDDFEVMHIA